ncbi:MAG: hypothetical protein K0R38_4091, partial [Polyangiaceae bacterium]|nr:hypothetical protein [Polyangiaceae bacterium]
MPPRPDRKRPAKLPKPRPAPSTFAPAAFLKGSPEAVRDLCEGLAGIAHERFCDLTGTTWERTGSDLARQLRAAGHDLTSFDDSSDLQEWQVTYYHTRGTFSLLLTF